MWDIKLHAVDNLDTVATAHALAKWVKHYTMDESAMSQGPILSTYVS